MIVSKKRFGFEPCIGNVDIFLDDMKVRGPHRGCTGEIWFRLTPDYECQVEPHDDRVGIDALINEEKGILEPFVPERTRPPFAPVGEQYQTAITNPKQTDQVGITRVTMTDQADVQVTSTPGSG